MIGIIGAMAEEVASLKNIMESYVEKQIHQVKFYVGQCEGKEIVLMQSGIGKVNAAYSTTILMEHFEIDILINIGTAGGLDVKENVGDVVIASRVSHHDVDCLAFNYAYGQVPGMPKEYLCDSHLLEITNQTLEELGIAHHTGLIVSGDQFVARQDQVDAIKKEFPMAIATEMEAAAISQVAHLYQVPFIILRSLSDIFGKGESSMQFDAYLALASANSSKLAKKVVGLL